MSDPVDVVAAHPWPPAFSPAFVDEARALLDAKSVLVIVGPVGGHRNRLAAEIAEIPAGASKNRHVGRFGDGQVPYFAVSQLFRTVQPPPDAPVDDVETSLRESLRDVDVPPRIVLANTDLCDPQSVDVLVRAAEAGAIRLIATLTAETVATRDRLMAAAGLIEIPALDRTAIGTMLRARFGAAPDPELSDLLLERSGGSSDVMQSLADASFVSGAIVVDDGVLRGTELLLSRTAEGLDGTGTITDLLHLTALLGQLDVDEARALFGDDLVDRATTTGALTAGDGALTFALPEEAMQVKRSLPQDRQIDLFERFADVLPRTVGRTGAAVPAADWWRAAGRLLPPDLAARAGREANLLGHYRRALVYTDPRSNDQHASVAPVERGFAFSELGDTDAILGMIAELDASTLSEDELYPYLRAVSVLSPDGERERLVAQAVASDDPVTRRRREAVRTLAVMVQEAIDTGDEKLANRVRSLAFSGQLSPGNRAIAFAALATVLHHSARPAQATEAAEFALEVLTEDRSSVSAYHLDTARELHVVALLSALDLPAAGRALATYSTGVFAVPGTGRVTYALQALVAMTRGDMVEALASAHLGLSEVRRHDPHQIRGWIEAIIAQSLVHLGRVGDARAALITARQHPSRLPQIDLARRTYIAATYDALAEPEEALEILTEVVDEARRRGLRLAQIDAAGAGVLIGGPPQVDLLLEAVDDLVDPSGTPQVWQAYARAARSYDISAIVELAYRLDALGARLFAAGVAQSVLDMARRATDLDHATRGRLHRLADLASRQPSAHD